MTRYFILIRAMTVIAAVMLCSCRPDPDLKDAIPDESELMTFSNPPGWPAPVYTFAGNALTQRRFELGRKLFYDVRLSRDNTISCGSCHSQFAAFAHLDHPLSHGIDGRFGVRNSPALFNLAWKPAFFWDGGVAHLESQPQVPIENHVEMDLALIDAVARLNADELYPALFKSAYDVDRVGSKQLFQALAQFMAAMVSSDSRYDRHMRGESGTMTQIELEGLELFRAKCGSCHREPLFSDYSFRNNGLQFDPGLNDSGRARITLLPEDMHKFMVPSLRNAELTRPYMHDGRFNTLDAVLEHYRQGITRQQTLDPLLEDGISMTDDEKRSIIAFLRTLTDQTFVKDKRFSEP